MLFLTSWRGRLHACIRNMQTRHRHPPFSRPIAVSSSAPLRSRNRGRRTIASSMAHTQSSTSDPTMNARIGKGLMGVGVGVEPPPPRASGTCAPSSSRLLKGEYMHLEEGALLSCGLLSPSRYRLWLCDGRRAAVAVAGRGGWEEIGVIALLILVWVSRIAAADRTCTHVAL